MISMLASHLFSYTVIEIRQKNREKVEKGPKTFSGLKSKFKSKFKFWIKTWFRRIKSFFRLFSRFFVEFPQRSGVRRTRAQKIANNRRKSRQKIAEKSPAALLCACDHQFDDFIGFQAGFLKETEIARSKLIFLSVRKSIYPTDNWPRECWDVKRCDIST